MRSVLLLLPLPLMLLAACSRLSPCNGSMIPVAALWLDASAWFAAHPGDTLHACVDGRCQDIAEADAKHPVRLALPPNTDNSKPMALVVTDASGLRVQRDFTPVRVTIAGPCATSYWKTPATLTADGRLQPA